MFAYGCCVGSWDRFMLNVRPRVPGGSPLLAASGHTGIVNAYNDFLDAAEKRDIEGIILVHDDLEIVDPRAEEKFREVLSDADVGIVGVAGGGGESIAWWDHAPVGHQQTDAMLIDFGMRAGEVSYLEGSILVIPQRVVQRVRFDPLFTEFHGYEEICMVVRQFGMRVVVADIDTHHHTQLGFKSVASSRQWHRANELYREKWFA
jgi:hypothetical protein